MVVGWIFVSIVVTLLGVAYMEEHGWPWLKKFNERREQAGFWSAFILMDMDDQKFAEWLSRKGRD